MHLFWIQGPRRQARLRLEGSFFVIGRAEPFPVFQDDATISREHAVVVETGQGISIKDLGSRNGVLLNGRKLGRYEEVPLRPGDELLVGRTTVRWLREGELEPPAPEGGATQQVTVDRDGRSDTRVGIVPVAPTELAAVEAPEEGEPEDEDALLRTEDALEEDEGREGDAEETVDLAPGEVPGEPESLAGEETEVMEAPLEAPAPEEPPPEEPAPEEPAPEEPAPAAAQEEEPVSRGAETVAEAQAAGEEEPLLE